MRIWLSIFNLFIASTLLGQTIKGKPEVKAKDTIPVYNRMEIALDLLSPILFTVGQPYVTAQVEGRVVLKQRFMPTLKLGYTYANKTSESQSIYQMNSGLFGSVGLNIRILGDINNMFYLGAHYLQSVYQYNISNLNLPPNYWGETANFEVNGINGHSGYAQATAGLNVSISDLIGMGWNVSYFVPIYFKDNSGLNPYIVPGVGVTKGVAAFNFGYNIFFKF